MPGKLSDNELHPPLPTFWMHFQKASCLRKGCATIYFFFALLPLQSSLALICHCCVSCFFFFFNILISSGNPRESSCLEWSDWHTEYLKIQPKHRLFILCGCLSTWLHGCHFSVPLILLPVGGSPEASGCWPMSTRCYILCRRIWWLITALKM